MNDLETAAARVKELAEKIVRCAERCDSYRGVWELEEQEYERLKREHVDAQKALIHAAQGNTLLSIQGFRSSRA